MSQLEAQFISSNIPVILIDLDLKEIPDDTRTVANMKIVNNPDGNRNYIDSNAFEYNGQIAIEVRGTTSQTYPKKQFAFETQYPTGENYNISLLGMPAENDWILYAPYSDKSLMRNVLAYQISRELGQYAPRTVFCELILNNEYLGVYVLIEKIKRDDHRVNIAEMGPSDVAGDALTGGYLYKIDRLNTECEYWITRKADVMMQCVYPRCEDITDAQLNYCQGYIDEFEAALFSEKYTDPERGYRAYIDLYSFLDYMFVNEVAKNVDGYFLSTYLYKERDSRGGKLIMGPVWDFNLGFGNADYRNAYSTDSIRALSIPWWSRMFEDPYFENAASKRWHHHREHALSMKRLDEIIDSISTILDEAQERNFKKWEILDEFVWPNYYVGPDYESEVQYLRDWLIYRLDWMDLYFSYEKPYTLIANSSLFIFTNPFNQYLTLEFNVEQEASVSFLFYDMMGNLESYISPDLFAAGTHRRTYYFDGSSSPRIEQGLYILVMLIDGVPVTTRKILRH